MKDTNSVAWVMPHGSAFGALGVPRGQTIFFQTLSCGTSNRRGWRAEQNASTFFILGSNWWPKVWNQMVNIIKLRLKCQYLTLCVLYKWKIQNISDGIFIMSPWSCPRGGTLGRWGAQWGGGGQKLFFETWSCGISNWQGCWAEQNASKIFILGSSWWPWVRSKGQMSLNFGYHVNFIFIPNFVCVLTNKR